MQSTFRTHWRNASPWKSRNIKTSFGKKEVQKYKLYFSLQKCAYPFSLLMQRAGIFFFSYFSFLLGETARFPQRHEAKQTGLGEHCFPTFNTQFWKEQNNSWSLHHLWSSPVCSPTSKALAAGRARGCCSRGVRASRSPRSIRSCNISKTVVSVH